MAVLLPPGAKYYAEHRDNFQNTVFLEPQNSVTSFLIRTPAGPAPLGSCTLFDQVAGPGAHVGILPGLAGWIDASTWARSSQASPSTGTEVPPYSSGVWFGLRDGAPSMQLFDGEYTGAGALDLTAATVLDFNRCYTISFVITWFSVDDAAAGTSAMRIYLGNTVATATLIASRSIPDIPHGGQRLWYAGTRLPGVELQDPGVGISLSIGSASDTAFPENESAYEISVISSWATSHALFPTQAVDFLGDWVPNVLALWSLDVYPDVTYRPPAVPGGALTTGYGFHVHFISPTDIEYGLWTSIGDLPVSGLTYVPPLSAAPATAAVECFAATTSPPVSLPPPPPVPVPPANPTNPHCTPETTVGNGGTGHSGCNPGGTGHVPTYFGPWGTVPQHPDPVDGEVLAGAESLDLWVEIVHTDFPSGDDTIYRRSFVELADPSSYQGGRKAGGLLGVGDIEHGIGNEQGGFEAATVDISYADGADRLFRRLLADQELEGDEVRIKIASIAGREAHVVPRILTRAVAQKPRLSSSLDASFSAADYLFSEFGPVGPGRQFPSWLIPETIFPTAPYDSLQLPIPVIYGEKSDEGATDPATGDVHPKGLVPLIYVGQQELETTHGVSAVPPFDGSLAGPPTSAVRYVLFPIGTLTFQASPNHAVVTNYIANLYAAGTLTPVLDTLSLGVPFPDSNNGIAVEVRAWLDGHAGGDYDVTVTAVTPDGSAESGVSNSFTVPVSAESGSGAGGWAGPVNTDPQFAIITIYQNRGSGLVLKRGPVVGYDSTSHNFRVTWTEAQQASEYYVFMYTAGSNWDAYTNPYAAATVRYKRVPASPTNSVDPAWDYFVDWTSPSDGLAWPPDATAPGSESGLWDTYLLAGHAIFDIISVYGSDLAEGGENPDATRVRLDPDSRGDILVPFFSRWGFPTTYRDFTAADGSVYRMTVLYATGPVSDAHKNGEISLCVNCIGIEDVGDGSGLPITDAHAVQQHWIENFLINNYRSGLWVVNGNHPAWEDGTAMVRSSSFAEAQYVGAGRLGDRGLTVGWYAGSQRVLQDWCREWNQSTDTRLGLNAHGQIVVKALDEAVDVSLWPQVLHDTDLFGDVVQVFGEERENVVSGICDWDPDKGQFRGKTQSFASERAITKYKNRRKEGTSIESTLLVEPSHLQWVLQRRLARLQEGAKTVEITGKVDFLDYEVGTGIRLTTVEGTGEDGYEDAPMLILRRRFTVADRLVTLTLLNMGDLLVPPARVFAIGDGEVGPTQGNPIGPEGDSVLVAV